MKKLFLTVIVILLLFVGCAFLTPMDSEPKPDFCSADLLVSYIKGDIVEVYMDDLLVNKMTLEQYHEIVENNRQWTRKILGKELQKRGFTLLEVLYRDEHIAVPVWDADGDGTEDFATLLRMGRGGLGLPAWNIVTVMTPDQARQGVERMKQMMEKDKSDSRKKEMMKKGRAI